MRDIILDLQPALTGVFILLVILGLASSLFGARIGIPHSTGSPMAIAQSGGSDNDRIVGAIEDFRDNVGATKSVNLLKAVVRQKQNLRFCGKLNIAVRARNSSTSLGAPLCFCALNFLIGLCVIMLQQRRTP